MSVTGEFESPDNFPPVTAAIWLSVTGLSLTALDSTQARNESHTKQSEPKRGNAHLPNQETMIEVDPGVTWEVSDLISTVNCDQLKVGMVGLPLYLENNYHCALHSNLLVK